VSTDPREEAAALWDEISRLQKRGDLFLKAVDETVRERDAARAELSEAHEHLTRLLTDDEREDAAWWWANMHANETDAENPGSCCSAHAYKRERDAARAEADALRARIEALIEAAHKSWPYVVPCGGLVTAANTARPAVSGATYICPIGCVAECSHGVPCLVGAFGRIDAEHPHPVKRGHLAHLGDDGRCHEWTGKNGRCVVTDWP
jgi:hypothetical protein